MALEHPVCDLLVRMMKFETPKTETLDFDAIIGGNLSYEARELLMVATQQRGTMMDGITADGDKVDPRNVIASIEHYLPSIYKITYSMESSASAQIKLNEPLQFSWTSALLQKTKAFKIGVLVFEVSFILTTQALALYNKARELLLHSNPNRSSNLVEAVSQLKQGAGILDFVAQILLPRWVSPPEDRPPEVRIEVLIALSTIFQCTAQRITIVQGIITEKPPSLIAKLLMGVSDRYASVEKDISVLNSRYKLLDALAEEGKIWPAICSSIAYRSLGLKAKTDMEIGQAIGYLGYAIDTLEAARVPACLNYLRDAVTTTQYVFHEQYKEYKEDNEKVYFMGVPVRDCLTVPSGVFMNNIVGFSLPDVEAVSFESKDPYGGNIETRLVGEDGEEVQEDSDEEVPNPPPASSGGIASWFGFSGSKPPPAPEKLTCPPGYDKTVFDQLPEDIQKEIVAEYKAAPKK